MAKTEKKLIANNKKAYHDYFLEERFEAGIELHGTEVKSMRMGKCSIKEAFVRIENGEVIVYGMHVSPYEKGNIFNKDPLRPKKLLMHKSEIRKLTGKLAEQGYTLVPVDTPVSVGEGTQQGLTGADSGNLTWSDNDPRIWYDDGRQYYYPIPQSAIIKNGNLKQNPGW